MFCFQRTVVFIDYQSLYVIHQVLVALYFGVGTERLVQDKVVVAFQGMTVDAGIIVAVAGVSCCRSAVASGRCFDVEGYVLDEAGSAGWRVPPTDGNMPERIAQYLEYSSGRSVKCTGM